MMRDKLAVREGQRSVYTGRVSKFSMRKRWHGVVDKTMLLVDVRDKNGMLVTDHLWFVVDKHIAKLQLQVHDVISFTARVKPYVKGYRGQREGIEKRQELDYQLEYPQDIVKRK